MTKEEFRLLKRRLYGALRNFVLSVESHPELKSFSVELSDGHELFPAEILSWFIAARANSWKFGPPEAQKRHVENILQETLRVQSPARQ